MLAITKIVVMIVLLVCVILMAMCLRTGDGSGLYVFGGAKRRGPDPALSPHIVIDTLNLAHWLSPKGAITPDSIIQTIDQTAPTLKLKHSDRVMYVVKDRETTFNDDAAREMYALAAKRNGVYVYVVERYADPPQGTAPSKEHSSRGRDDLFVAMLAYRYRCAVLTEDKLRDFDRFRATIPPFHVYEYAFWRELPHREFVRPDAPAHSRLKKPTRLGFARYFRPSPEVP